MFKQIDDDLEHLSEDAIKKAGIRFLKEYYKYRPRTGKTISSLDQATDDGIITDGMFTFVADDGSPFLATLEATSQDTKNEVVYNIQQKLLKWDSAVSAAFLAVIFFVFSHYYDWVTINKSGWLLTLLLLVLLLASGFYTFKWIFKGFQRYRYIYAIEQFKKYHADEQWIAIADDLFEENTDVYLKELKTQCVSNGFGLLSVNEEGIARSLITPSRTEVFGKTRASKHFLNRDEYSQSSKMEKARNYWDKVLSKIQGKRYDDSLNRYKRTFTSQILLCLVAVFIISGIFYKEATESPIAYVNEKKYEKKLSLKSKQSKAETEEFIIHSHLEEENISKSEPDLEEAEIKEKIEDNNQQHENEMAEYFDNNDEQNASIYISTEEGKFVSYDCERFLNYSGTKYIIQEGTYKEVSAVKKQLVYLKNNGLNANSIWMGCINDQESDYIIFIDLLFDEKEEAELIAKNLQRRFQLKTGYFKIRSITV